MEAIVKTAPDSAEPDFASIARKARMNGRWKATSSEALKDFSADLTPSFSAVMFLLDGAARYRMIHPFKFRLLMIACCSAKHSTATFASEWQTWTFSTSSLLVDITYFGKSDTGGKGIQTCNCP